MHRMSVRRTGTTPYNLSPRGTGPDEDTTLMPQKHRDTSVSLHPLRFDDAIKALAQPPKHEDSEAGESGSSTEAAPGARLFLPRLGTGRRAVGERGILRPRLRAMG